MEGETSRGEGEAKRGGIWIGRGLMYPGQMGALGQEESGLVSVVQSGNVHKKSRGGKEQEDGDPLNRARTGGGSDLETWGGNS